MLPLAVPVVATLADPGAAKNLRGVGTVEKKLDASTYVIGTARGHVTVTTLDGSLEVNSMVAISSKGNRLTIQPLPPSSRESLSALDSYAATGRAAESVSDGGGGETPAAQVPVLKLDKEEPEAFIRFASAREAARWLDQQGAAPGQTAKMEQNADPGRPVVVHTYRGADGAANAAVLDNASATAELEHFIAAELKSPVWQRIGSQALAGVLQARGTVSAAQLVAIDQALMSAGAASTPSSAGIPDLESRLQQWLTVVLDSRNVIAAVAGRPPLYSAADIIALYQEIVGGSGIVTQSIVPGLTQETLVSGSPGLTTAIPDTVGLLGLNLEQQLLGADVDSVLAGSVKGQLYQMLATAGAGQGTAIPATPDQEATVFRAALEKFSLAPRDIAVLGISLEKAAGSAMLQFNSVRASLPDRVDAALAPVLRSIEALAVRLEEPAVAPTDQINAFVQSVSKDISAVINKVPAFAQAPGIAASMTNAGASAMPDALTTLQSSVQALKQWIAALPAAPLSPDLPIPPVSSPATEGPAAVPAFKDTLSAVARSIDQVVGRISHEVAGFSRTSASDASEVSRQADTLVRPVQESLRALSETIARRADALLQRIEPLIHQKAATGAPATTAQKQIEAMVRVFTKETQDLVQNTVRSIRSQILLTPDDALPGSMSRSGQAGARIAQEIKNLETLVTGTGRQAEQAASNTGSPAVMTAEHLRQQVETALNRIESLQVLARPTQTSDGQQQILALPMRIDGEWKEVTIRLLRRQAGKGAGKGTKRGYGVQIAVSPAAAGDMAIAMDYRPGTPLSVHMNFALPRSRRWFEENRAGMTTALRGAGFDAVNLQFGMLTSKKHDGDIQGAAATGVDTGGGKIDIKV